MPGVQRAPNPARTAAAVALPAAALGAAAAYFLDPELGRRRRHVGRDRMARALRRRARRFERQARYEAGKAVGLAHRLTSHPEPFEYDDVSLVRRVETGLFRDRSLPKGSISINADRGIVVLRGQLESATDIAEIEQRVRDMPGVRGVENLLHLAGTPAPAASPRGVLRPAGTTSA
jgi:osmotically-inducible protein OsmY